MDDEKPKVEADEAPPEAKRPVRVPGDPVTGTELTDLLASLADGGQPPANIQINFGSATPFTTLV